jgi:hypothetical protein
LGDNIMSAVLFAAALILSACVHATEYTGIYLRQPEGTEYESVFMPCGFKEIWRIERGPAYQQLVTAYENTPHQQYGEVLATLELKVTKTDRTLYPQEHSDGEAVVERVIRVKAGTCKTKQ